MKKSGRSLIVVLVLFVLASLVTPFAASADGLVTITKEIAERDYGFYIEQGPAVAGETYILLYVSNEWFELGWRPIVTILPSSGGLYQMYPVHGYNAWIIDSGNIGDAMIHFVGVRTPGFDTGEAFQFPMTLTEMLDTSEVMGQIGGVEIVQYQYENPLWDLDWGHGVLDKKDEISLPDNVKVSRNGNKILFETETGSIVTKIQNQDPVFFAVRYPGWPAARFERWFSVTK